MEKHHRKAQSVRGLLGGPDAAAGTQARERTGPARPSASEHPPAWPRHRGQAGDAEAEVWKDAEKVLIHLPAR